MIKKCTPDRKFETLCPFTCMGQSVRIVLAFCRPYFGLSMARARAVISGRFFRVLPQPAGGGEIEEDGGGYRRNSSRVPFQAGDGWRQRADKKHRNGVFC